MRDWINSARKRYEKRPTLNRLSESSGGFMRADVAIILALLVVGVGGLALWDRIAVMAARVPTLLVTGKRSPRLLNRLTDRLQELLPHTTRIGFLEHRTHARDIAPACALQRTPASRRGERSHPEHVLLTHARSSSSQ